MPGRRLNADERALWRKVVADVTPLRPVDASRPLPVRAERVEAPSRLLSKTEERPFDKPVQSEVEALRVTGSGTRASPNANTLDASWDRRLRRGAVAPDRIVDLHGHTLGAAHATLDAALAAAVAQGDRVLLIVAGRHRPDGARGAIRRSIGDWLAASRFASRIAAVRAAHPRHGGGGAFYLILRR